MPDEKQPPSVRWVEERTAQVIEALSARGFLPDVLAVSDIFHVPIRELLGFGRTKSVVMARRHAYLAVREKYGLSFPELGMLFGRDHSSIIYGCRLAAHERATWERERGERA